MVAFNDPRLGYACKPCLARPMLYGALDAFERGDYIAAGCKVREAVRRFLVAACGWYGVEPKRRGKRPTPTMTEMACALRKAGHLTGDDEEWLNFAAEVGHKLAHCQSVPRRTLLSAIDITFAVVSDAPFCPHDRQPIVTCFDPENGSNPKGGAV